MATGYMKIKNEKVFFKFKLNKPIEERKMGNYAKIINGNLYLSLGAHYIMFCFDKELKYSNKHLQYLQYLESDRKYYTDIWNEIISMENLDVSYNPSYERLDDGIIDFSLYFSLDDRNHYEVRMAMDLFYNSIDVI
jgi:hypothetical protein